MPDSVLYCNPDCSEYSIDDILSSTFYRSPVYDMNLSGECLTENGFITCGSPTCGEGQVKKGDSCIPAAQGCGENYKASDGICYRVRYTPAEAAQVADEANTIFLYYK